MQGLQPGNESLIVTRTRCTPSQIGKTTQMKFSLIKFVGAHILKTYSIVRLISGKNFKDPHRLLPNGNTQET